MNHRRFLSHASIAPLFTMHGLEPVTTVDAVQSGFTNNLHIINQHYVLKVCGTQENEKRFENEAFFYQYFQGKIPVPRLLAFDHSKRHIDSYYMIYELIIGETVFAKWSAYSLDEREHVVRQLAHILKTINEAPQPNNPVQLNWKEERLTQIQSALAVVRQQSLLEVELIARIERYIEKYITLLNQQKLGITYWDLHFDNVLVSGSEVVGIIDFEGVDTMSIDYALDTIRRLSQYPEIYAPEGIDEHVKRHKEDYRIIFSLFKKYYPELFDFKRLEHRLNLYSIEYDLKLLPQFPNSQSLKNRLQTYLPDAG